MAGTVKEPANALEPSLQKKEKSDGYAVKTFNQAKTFPLQRFFHPANTFNQAKTFAYLSTTAKLYLSFCF